MADPHFGSRDVPPESDPLCRRDPLSRRGRKWPQMGDQKPPSDQKLSFSDRTGQIYGSFIVSLTVNNFSADGPTNRMMEIEKEITQTGGCSQGNALKSSMSDSNSAILTQILLVFLVFMPLW